MADESMWRKVSLATAALSLKTDESWAPHAPNVLFTPPRPAVAPPFAGAATSQAIHTNPPLGTFSARGLDPQSRYPYSHSF